MKKSNTVLLDNDFRCYFYRWGRYEGDLFNEVILEVLLKKLIHKGIIRVDEILEESEELAKELAYERYGVTDEDKRAYKELGLDFRQLITMECDDRWERIRFAIGDIPEPEKREHYRIFFGYDKSAMAIS